MTYDAIVVGGGPGGSTAAWSLARAGARTLLMDAARFPRVKLCAGWVTPRVWRALELDPAHYPHTLQPFARAALALAGAEHETAWTHVVSYGIVRREFDDFLLERARAAGARVLEETRVGRLDRVADGFAAETRHGLVSAPVWIGAGGHHCPVARALGEIVEREQAVVALESETRVGRGRLDGFAPRPGVPEIFPEHDLRGYGWYFSKGDFLNVGIGAFEDGRGIHRRNAAFLDRLRESGRLPGDVALEPFRGHAYGVRGRTPRRLAGPGFFLVGDAAALARAGSGEGIGPAVESGVLAAGQALSSLAGRAEEAASGYRQAIESRFGRAEGGLGRIAAALPASWLAALGRWVCRTAWLRRHVVFEGLFGMERSSTARSGEEAPCSRC